MLSTGDCSLLQKLSLFQQGGSGVEKCSPSRARSDNATQPKTPNDQTRAHTDKRYKFFTASIFIHGATSLLGKCAAADASQLRPIVGRTANLEGPNNCTCWLCGLTERRSVIHRAISL